MGMTIDECIAILSYPTYYFPSVREEALDMTIDTMRKYQKIQEIYSDYLKYMNPDNLADRIGEVLEDGNDDN